MDDDDFYKEDSTILKNERHDFESTNSKTSGNSSSKKIMNEEESWEYFDKIFKQKIENLDDDLNHENICFVLTFLASGLEEFDIIDPKYLIQHNLLEIIRIYLEFLKNTQHKDEAQYIIVSKVINSLLRMKLLNEMDLFNAKITNFFLEIINEQREICRMKMNVSNKLNELNMIKQNAEMEAIENGAPIPETPKEWADEFNKNTEDYKLLLSDVNYYYLQSLSYFFEYFISPNFEPKIKLCLPFFEFLQKYILDMPYTADMKRSLFFMDCFIRYMPVIERKHFKRANRCAYSILTSKHTNVYPDALVLLSSIITREPRQTKVFLDHFLDLFFNLLDSTEEETVIESFNVIEALLMTIVKIGEVPEEEIYPHIKIPTIFHHLDSISASESIGALKVLRAIACLGQTGVHLLIENDILDTFVIVNENTSRHVKNGMFLVLAAMMKQITPDTAPFLIKHPIFKNLFEMINSFQETTQISFLYGLDNALAVCEANNSLEEIEEYLITNDFIPILEELSETGEEKVAELAETYINKLTSDKDE